MKHLLRSLMVLLVLALVAACAPITPDSGSASGAASAPTTLNVFAAASLTDAFSEIGTDFDAAHPGNTTVFNFGGSNALATQIGELAPADVFASANNTQMNVVIGTGRILTGTPETFVRNRLVIVAPSDNPAALESVGDLTTPGIKLVLAAPEVPVGQYALDFLDKAEAAGTFGADFKANVLANLVSNEENVRAVLTKIELGEADAGIVYTSDAATAAGEVTEIAIPDELNTIASYPIAALTDTAQPDLAAAFVAWVLSAEGQAVLADNGFIPASE